jgi:microcystin-dependent protein
VADAHTVNLNLTLPEVGSSPDTWGDKINADMTAIDALFPQGAKPAVQSNPAGNADIPGGVDIHASPDANKFINFYTGDLIPANLRWSIGVANDPEGPTGSNAGSTLVFYRYSDAGAAIGNAFGIVRSTGRCVFEATPTIYPGYDVYHQGNLDPVLATMTEPVGTVKMYVGTSDPSGGVYMLCDGRAISRTTYATLFGVIGVVYGAGDGSTTFNIPNTAERVIIGKSATQTLIPQYDARAMGNSFGEGRHTQLPAELAAHVHTIAAHHHDVKYTVFQAGGTGTNFMTAITGAGAITAQTQDTPLTSDNNVGGGSPLNVVQPSLVMQFIIRVK